MRILSIIIVVLGSASALIAQDKPVAILVDEFEVLSCDHMLGRLDTYFQEMRNEPESTGVIVTFGPASRKHRIAFQQSVFEKQAKWRQLDVGRFQFLRANSEDKIFSQFWRVPPGASPPDIPGLDLSRTIPSNLKPFMMGEDTKMGDQTCPELDDAETFAMFLKANPTARGNLVVRDFTLKRAQLKAPNTVRRFSSKYGIPRDRLRVFAAKYEWPPNIDEPVVEYWYLP